MTTQAPTPANLWNFDAEGFIAELKPLLEEKFLAVCSRHGPNFDPGEIEVTLIRRPQDAYNAGRIRISAENFERHLNISEQVRRPYRWKSVPTGKPCIRVDVSTPSFNANQRKDGTFNIERIADALASAYDVTIGSIKNATRRRAEEDHIEHMQETTKALNEMVECKTSWRPTFEHTGSELSDCYKISMIDRRFTPDQARKIAELLKSFKEPSN
jgi:hypothetical protein